MKKYLILSILIISTVNLFALDKADKSVAALREAQNYYENCDYGKSLKYAEDSILFRKQKIEAEEQLLTNSLASKEVQRAGNKINSVIEILNERDEYECVELINRYLNKKGEAYFNNSITNLIEYIKSQIQYPEAYKLIADIYKLEGEYTISEEYYLKAIENEDVLDIPDEKYSILYQLAELSKLQGDYEKMEIRLLNIIGNSKVEKNKVVVRAMRNTVSKNNKEALTKLFQLYRADDFYALNAYSLLAQYYIDQKAYDKAFNYSALSVITGFTKIEGLLEKRNLDYKFTDLESYFDEIQFHSDIIEWGRDNDIWQGYNLFCEICDKLDYDNFAFEMLKVLAFNAPEKYWQQNAVLKLDKLDGIKNPEPVKQ